MTRAAVSECNKARLCRVVEGVEYWVENGSSGHIRALVLAEALRTHYGAGDDPNTWLHAYEHNRHELAKMTMALYGRTGHRGIVVLEGKGADGPVGIVCPTDGTGRRRRR